MGARRSEVVALEATDLRLTDEGFEVTIRRSKTDQEGEGHKIKNGRPTARPLDGRDLARIVKAAAERAGLAAGDLAGHSLRAGLITQAARQGKTERDIIRHTGHRSATTLRRYIRAAELFVSSNPA